LLHATLTLAATPLPAFRADPIWDADAWRRAAGHRAEGPGVGREIC
jgi:hypothetical protein